jgi:hypothetical protein
VKATDPTATNTLQRAGEVGAISWNSQKKADLPHP